MLRHQVDPLPDFEIQYSELIALIEIGTSITIAEAAERTGLSAELITHILAIHYAIADELLKLVDPSGQSLH